MTDSWYLRADEYYVPADKTSQYPPRQGDIFGPVELVEGSWPVCQLIHPTCELGKQAVGEVQVAKVHRLDEIKDEHQQAAVCTGWTEKGGVIQVAHANTFFLAPLASLDGNMPLFSNFREVHVVNKGKLLERRIAAITPEVRVSFIRRMIYFLYRLPFSMSDVMAWEARRISTDPAYEGPRPFWAQPEEAGA